MYSAKIICDSISETEKRLTTFEITFPRIVLAEFNTHRMFSRNSASSRAIPFLKQLERVTKAPFIPERFPINGKGMQPDFYIEAGDIRYNLAYNSWLDARDSAVKNAIKLYESIKDDHSNKNLSIHKQIVNRLLEPFMWHTVIVTATEFDNFFKLRTDENAQYEIRRIADLMYEAYHFIELNEPSDLHLSIASPELLKVGEWHLPFIFDEDTLYCDKYLRDNPVVLPAIVGARNNYILGLLKKISVARCARVSYLTHDGKRDIEKDLELFERLRTSGHWSPFEHIATPYFTTDYEDSPKDGYDLAKDGKSIDLRSGNFIGWKQFRKEFADENYTYFRKESK